VDVFASYISIDTLNAEVLRGEAQDAPWPDGRELEVPPAPAAIMQDAEPSDGDQWSENFAHSLQVQHTRIREFLQAHGERWRKMVAHFTRQIEKLQSAIAGLTADNEELREQAALAAENALRGLDAEVSRGYAADADEARLPAPRNAELPRQMRTASAALARASQPAFPAEGNDWESQKRRMLAELESDDAVDVASSGAASRGSRLQIEEVIARTDKIIAEKDREIEELKHLLDSQSGSVGALAVGAAALEQVFDQDEIIREERQRLQQAQEELRAKLRQSEIDHAMERARLARKEAEIDERLRNGEPGRSTADADAEALAPTGRPVRGRWRAQLGLGDG
jgi:hypothetical protein